MRLFQPSAQRPSSQSRLWPVSGPRFRRLKRCLAGAIALLFCIALLLPAPALAASSSSLKASRIEDGQKDFVGLDLKTEEFVNLNLQGADFTGADLRGAVFNGTNLRDANLTGVDFSDGISYGSSFSHANLTDAVLNSAMLLQSYFTDTTVTNADFTFAVIDGVQLSLLCQTASGVNSKTGVDTRDSLGCADSE